MNVTMTAGDIILSLVIAIIGGLAVVAFLIPAYDHRNCAIMVGSPFRRK